MNGDGRLDILIERVEGGARVLVTSSRPIALSSTFIGMPADAAIATVPLLFSVCGVAQAAAAAEAVGAARGDATVKRVTRSRQLLVLAEAAREHLIAVLQSWTMLAGAEPDAASLLSVMRWFKTIRSLLPAHRCDGNGAEASDPAIMASIAELEQLVERHVTAEPLAAFLERTCAARFVAWSAGAKTSAQRLAATTLREAHGGDGAAPVRPLPDGCARVLAPRLLAGDRRRFLSAPDWQGKPSETTALTRQRGMPLIVALSDVFNSGVVTRLAARVVELARLSGQMREILHEGAAPVWAYRAQAIQSGTGTAGISEIETVRGRLIHAVRLEGDRIADYAILAPTEWNFNPAGVVAEGLNGIAATQGDISLRARTFINMLDPCVAFDVRVA